MRYFTTVGLCCALLSTVLARCVGRRSTVFGRLGGVLLLAMPLAAVLLGPLAARADAQPQIKVNCKVYATNHVDPIAFSTHLHHQIGNTSTTNKSTGQSLFDKRSTSCSEGWFTSAGWFPKERHERVKGVNVYYRAPGDQRTIRAIPKGLQLLATDQQYTCNDGPMRDTPPYGCKARWSTSVIFPDCIDKNRLANEATNAVSSRSGKCPRSHPYRIPKISYLVMHYDGGVPNPLQVSAGVSAWEGWHHMHADYFAANQSVFNDRLLDLCLRKAPDRVAFADRRCGVPPGR